MSPALESNTPGSDRDNGEPTREQQFVNQKQLIEGERKTLERLHKEHDESGFLGWCYGRTKGIDQQIAATEKHHAQLEKAQKENDYLDNSRQKDFKKELQSSGEQLGSAATAGQVTYTVAKGVRDTS